MDRIRSITDQVISEEERLLSIRIKGLTHSSSTLMNLFIKELFFTAFLVNANIVKPLNTISDAILENEINSISNISVKHKDEIGLLVDEFIKMDRNIKQKKEEKRNAYFLFKNALAEVKTQQEIIPICSYCHKIRGDEGTWNQLELYIKKNFTAEFSHGICTDFSEW